jgi:hypothetical protein
MAPSASYGPPPVAQPQAYQYPPLPAHGYATATGSGRCGGYRESPLAAAAAPAAAPSAGALGTAGSSAAQIASRIADLSAQIQGGGLSSAQQAAARRELALLRAAELKAARAEGSRW